MKRWAGRPVPRSRDPSHPSIVHCPPSTIHHPPSTRSMNMRTIHLSAVGGIILSLFLATGCEEVSRRGTAPDDSPATQRDIDQVNSEARIKKQEIDQTYRDQSLNIGFRQNLIKEKAAQEDAQVDIDRDKVVQPLKITLQSER